MSQSGITDQVVREDVGESSIGLIARAYLRLFLFLSLLVIPIIIVPYVLTQTPAVHSKDWALRAIAAMVILVAPLVHWRRGLAGLDLFEAGLLGLLGCSVISALLSGRVVYCFSEHWQTVACIGLAWIVYRLQWNVADYRKVVAIVALAGALCTLYGLLTYAGVDVLKDVYAFIYDKEQGGRNFVHSFFGNPEYFGGYAAPVAALCFSQCLRPRAGLVTRGAWIGLTLVIMLALALSGTRGAFLGLGAGLVLLVARQLPVMSPIARRRSLLVLIAGLVAAVAGAVILSTPNPLNRRDMQLIQRFAEAGNLRSASVRERLFFFTVAARGIAKHPVFGAGPGTFRLDFFPEILDLEASDPHASLDRMGVEMENRVAEHPHSDYLEYWYELGTVGMAVLLFLVALTLSRFLTQAWRYRHESATHAELQLLNAGFFAAVVCLLINAAFSFPLHMAARGSLFWILLGCFFASDRQLRKKLPGAAEVPA